VIDFARARGFSVVKDDVSILQLHRDGASASAHTDPLTAALQGPVAELHDRLFPDTFLPSSRMLQASDDTHCTFVIADGGRLLGYAHGHIDTDAAIGSLEYVGVVETARDRGIGTRLVQAFCAWAFSFEAIREVALMVDRDNAAARHVYAKLGFEHLFDARGARRAWPNLAEGIA
jgi:RimJ/RimL family protein N-acetyltransferase